MGNENLEDALNPTPALPQGSASSQGQRLRPKILRDRPVVSPTDPALADPDPEVTNQRLRNQLRQKEPTPGTPEAFQPFYDPNRFNYTALRSPYARSLFRDEIEIQAREDAARQKEQVARRREAERQNKEIQSQLESEQKSELAAQKEREWNIADLEKARTGREYVEDPDRPGFPRPVLSGEEWKAELQAKKAEETAEKIKERRTELENRAKGYMSGYKAQFDAAKTELTDTDYNERRIAVANNILQNEEQEISNKLEEANKNIGFFKFGAKEKKAKQDVAELEARRERLYNMRVDPSYVDKVLSENQDNPLIDDELRREQENRAIRSEAEAKRARINKLTEQWKGNIPSEESIRDEEFEKWIESDHDEYQGVGPANQSIKEKKEEVSANEISELPYFKRQVEAAKLSVKNREIWSGVESTDAELQGRMASVEEQSNLVNSLRQGAGTTLSGQQITNDQIRAEEQKLQQLEIDAEILSARKQGQIDTYNEVVKSQNRVAELAQADRQSGKPVNETAIEVKAFPEDRESWLQQSEAAVKGPDPQPYLGSSYPSYNAFEVEKNVREQKTAARNLAQRRALVAKGNAVAELMFDGKQVGWVEEKVLPNGDSGEVWNVYRNNLQSAFPSAAGREIKVVEDPRLRLEMGEGIFKTSAFDPFEDYKAPVGVDPEIVTSFLEDTRAVLSGGQASEFAVEELQITPEKIAATSALIEKFKRRNEELFKKSGVQDIFNQVAAGTLDEVEGERLYKQKVDEIYGPGGLGRERNELQDQILGLRNAAFAGGGDFSQVIDLARKAGMSLEQPEALEPFIDEWVKENVSDTPISTDYMEALDEYRKQNGGLVMLDPMTVLDYRDKIMMMLSYEEQLKNRLAEKLFGEVVVGEMAGMYGENIQLVERRDLELSLEQEKKLQDMVREEARREGFNPKGFSDAPIRILSGAVNMFPAKGVLTLGHMMGPGDSINELVRRPSEKYVEHGKEYNIWTEDTIRRAEVGGGKNQQTGEWMPPQKINAVQYRKALEVFQDSQSYKKLSTDAQKQIGKELDYISAVIGEDIENNPLVRWAEAVEEGVQSGTNPLNDRNYFAHGMTGLGSMGGFWAGGLIGRASLLRSGAMRGSNFIRRASPEEKIFRFGPKSSFAGSHPLGLIGFQGAMVNSTEGFRQLEMAAERAAADPDLDFDEQVNIQKSILTMIGYMGLGYTEGLPIERIFKMVDMTKVPPTFWRKFNSALANTLAEGGQEGLVAVGNVTVSELTLPTPGRVEAGGVDYGPDLGRSFVERFNERIAEDGTQIVEETAIGGLMGLGSTIIENLMLGRKFRKAKRRQDVLIDAATRATEAKLEALQGEDAAEAIYENMPDGSAPPTQEEVDEINATYGGSREAAKPGGKSVAVMRKELESATETYGWDSPQTREAEMALTAALALQGQDAGRRMGRQVIATRENAEQLAQIDEDIATAEKQFFEAEKSGGFVAAAEAEKALNELRAQRVRIQQANIATKIAQGRSEYLSDSDWDLVRNGNEELGVGPAIEDFKGVPVVNKEIIEWATENAPAQAALVEMSRDETVKRIEDGRMGELPTPELQETIPLPSDRFAEQERLQQEAQDTPVDETVGQIPDYDPRMFRIGQGQQGPGEAKFRQAGPQIVEDVVRSLGRSFPNLTEQEVANVAYMLMERLAQRTKALEGAFRNVEVMKGMASPAAVTQTGNLRVDPANIIRAALSGIAEGGSIQEAIDFVDGVMAEETTHNIVRWLLRSVGGDERVAEIYEALSQETKDTVGQAYFSYTYDKAMRQDGIDLTSVPIEEWPEQYREMAERMLDPVYMGHEYLNMVIEQARTGQVSVALLPPKNMWDKLLELLESLAEAIGFSLQDPNLDPDIRRQIEDIRDYTIEAMNQIESGALNLFAEEKAPDTIKTPKDRIEYLRESGISLMVAAQYRQTGVSVQELITAADRGLKKAAQKGGQNFAEEAIQAAQQEIENLLDKLKVPAEGRPGTIRPNLIEKILSYNAQSEAEAWRYGEIIKDDIVKTLPTKQRQVMERKGKGFSSTRIGKELGLNLRAVENIAKEAEKTIQQQLDKAAKIRGRNQRTEDLSAPARDVERSSRKIDQPFPTDRFGPDQGAAPRNFPNPRTILTGDDLDTDLYIPTGYKHAKWGEGDKNDLTWTEDPANIRSMDHDPDVDAVITGVFRYGTGVTGMDMLAWLRSELGGDAKIEVADIVADAEGFYQKAVEYELIDDYFPKYSEEYWDDDEVPIQNAALREDPEELTQIWSDSHPLTKNPDGTPVAFYRGHFDDDLFSIPSRPSSFLGPGVYFTNNVGDASAYADYDNHPDGAGEEIQVQLADRIAEEEGLDIETAMLKAQEIMEVEHAPRITPVYLHGKKWFQIMPYEVDQPRWTFEIDYEVDAYKEDALNKLILENEADLRQEYEDALELYPDLGTFENYVKSEKEDEINEAAQEMAFETNYDPRESGEIAELFNGILDELRDSFTAEETLIEFGEIGIAELRDGIQQAKLQLSEYGSMTMTEIAQRVFGLHPMTPESWSRTDSMIPVGPGVGGFLLGLGLRRMGYDGIIMDATTYFPGMDQVNEMDTVHAMVFDAKPVYGMFGGVARKRRDPLQWAAKRAGFEEVKPLITSKKSDIIDVARGKIYSQDMGTVIVRELLQNSLDAIRPQIAKGQRPQDQKVTLFLDPENRVIEVTDTGHGMPPEVVASALVDITKSFKETDGAGGYGLAKAVIFGNSKQFEVETVYQERDGSWSKTIMTGDAQNWENTINEDPNGVRILTERNFEPSEALEPEEVKIESEWFNQTNAELTGKYLPTGNAFPEGIRFKHAGYQVRLEVSPELIPNLPEVFQNEESIEEIASIINDEESQISGYLDDWVRSWVGDDRYHGSADALKSSVAEYRSYIENQIDVFADVDQKFIDRFSAFTKDSNASGLSDISRTFKGLIGQLPPPLQKKIYDHWAEKFPEAGLRPLNQEPVSVDEEWNGVVLKGYFNKGDDFAGFIGRSPEQAYFSNFGFSVAEEDIKLGEALKKYLSSEMEDSVYVTGKPTTYTRVRSTIDDSVQFDFSMAEKTFELISENDTTGTEFEIGTTGAGLSVDDLTEKTPEGRKAIKRLKNTSQDLEFIKQVNALEANYKIYRSENLVSSNRLVIQVLNRGIWQFSTIADITAQVQLPEKLVIDVHPNVDATHDDYPFTAGRDNFHGVAIGRNESFYKNYEQDAMVSKNKALKSRWDASPTMTLPSVRNIRVVDVSGSNSELAQEIVNHEPSNQLFAKMAATFKRVQTVLMDNGFDAAEKGDLVAWNIGQDAIGVNYKTKVHVGEQDLNVIGEKEYAISLDPSIILNRSIENSKRLGLDQYGTIVRKFATDSVTTMLHEITHNGGFGDASENYTYQLTENVSRMALENLNIIDELADDLETIFTETDLQQFLQRVDSQQDQNDSHDYAVFIQGTPTGRDGANFRLGSNVDIAPGSRVDQESSQVGSEVDTEATERTQSAQQSLPDLQAAARRQSINRRPDAFGNTRDRAGRLIEVSGDIQWPKGSGPNGGWNVLSLFDGIAAGRQALKNLAVPVDNYYGSEIEKSAIAIAKHNHPDIQELGDVTKVTGDEIPKIDLLWGGSPCQGFSRAGKRKGMEDPRSKLFWDYVRLWKKTAPRFFLLENVRMKPEDEAIITRALGVAPIRINGNLLTGANRDRLYWTNISVTQPMDIGVELKHVIQPRASKDLLWNRAKVDAFMSKPKANGTIRWNNSNHSDVRRPKAMALVKSMDKGYPKNLLVDKQGQYRKFSMAETARLMGLPDEYLSDVPDVANGNKYAGAGNSWAVPVIEHILQHAATQPKGLQASAQRFEADQLARSEYQMHAIRKSGALVHLSKHPDTMWHVEVGRPERQVIGMFDNPKEATAALSIWAVSKDLKRGDTIRSIDHGGRSFEVISTDNYKLQARDQMTGQEGELDFTKVFRTRPKRQNAAQREMQTWPMNFPMVQSHSTLVALKGKKGSEKEARHERAKKGDLDAAMEIVTEVMKPEKAQELASLYPGAVLATPNSRENNFTNAIPEAMAAWISHTTGMPMEESLHEVGQANHTKANAWERLFRVPQYGGEIDPTKEYVLVDDVSTSGSTFNSMRSYIQEQGGTVVASVAIASPNSPQNGPGWVLQPTSEALTYIDDYYREGEIGGIEAVSELLSKHALSPVATLTNSQIWLLAGGKPNRKKPVEWTLKDLDRRLEAGRKAEEDRQIENRAQGAARRSIDLWGKPKQRFSSKDTARGNAGGIPAGYRYLSDKGLIKPGQKVLDIGTGPFRYADSAVEEMGAQFYSYDPQWEERSDDVKKALAEAIDGKSDVVVTNNVLNLIPEKTNQRRLILQAENALKPGGKFYVTIYRAPEKGQVGDRDQFQVGESLNYYRGLIETVFGKGNVIRDGEVLIALKEPTAEQWFKHTTGRAGDQSAASRPVVYEENGIQVKDMGDDVYRAYVGRNLAGQLALHSRGWDERGRRMSYKTFVKPEFRRRGVATAMYRAAESNLEEPLYPSGTLSDEGFKFWLGFRPDALPAKDLRRIQKDLVGKRVTSPSDNNQPGTIKAAGGVGENSIVVIEFDSPIDDRNSTTSAVAAREVADQLPQIAEFLDSPTGEQGAAPRDIASRISSKQDADYLAAVESGDMETAQRMVDEAAMAAGYWRRNDYMAKWAFKKIGITPNQIKNLQNAEKLDEKTEKQFARWNAPQAISFDGSMEEATGRYGNISTYTSVTGASLFTRYSLEVGGEARGFIIVSSDNPGSRPSGRPPKIFAMYVAPEFRGDGVSTKLVDFALNHQGSLDSDWMVSKDAAKRYSTYLERGFIKSADPVTRDADGNVIPLSQRFNPKSDLLQEAAQRQFPAQRSSGSSGFNSVSSIHDASRIGTAKQGNKIPSQEDIVTRERVAPEHLEKQMGMMTHFTLPRYDRIAKKIKGIEVPLPRYFSDKRLTAETRAKRLHDFFVENLLFLHDLYDTIPNGEKLRQRASLWYDGARILADNAASDYGVTAEQAAGVFATLSPGKDWFQNVQMGHNLMDVWQNHMDRPIRKADAKDPKSFALYESVPEELAYAEGKTLRDLLTEATKDKKVKSDFYWAFRFLTGEVHGLNYKTIYPEGRVGGIAQTKAGQPAGMGWQAASGVWNAFSVLQDGSLENISASISNDHKVRNFYNNIIAPNNGYGDGTIDTHHVAAAFMFPLAQKDYQVGVNFGSSSGFNLPDGTTTSTSGSAGNGLTGLYWAHLEALRDAAAQRGIQPRQMQSITWEMIRQIFAGKGPKMVAEVAELWDNNKSSTDFSNVRSALTANFTPSFAWDDGSGDGPNPSGDRGPSGDPRGDGDPEGPGGQSGGGIPPSVSGPSGGRLSQFAAARDSAFPESVDQSIYFHGGDRISGSGRPDTGLVFVGPIELASDYGDPVPVWVDIRNPLDPTGEAGAALKSYLQDNVESVRDILADVLGIRRRALRGIPQVGEPSQTQLELADEMDRQGFAIDKDFEVITGPYTVPEWIDQSVDLAHWGLLETPLVANWSRSQGYDAILVDEEGSGRPKTVALLPSQVAEVKGLGDLEIAERVFQGAAQRDIGNLDEEGSIDDEAVDAARVLSEEVGSLADFISDLQERKKEVEGEVQTAVPRLANISDDENVRAAHSVVQWAYDREREKLSEPDMMAEGRRMADQTPAAVENAILEAGSNRTSLGSAEMVYAAKIVLSRAWRDATASEDPQAISRARLLSHAYQRTRTEVARELAAGRDPSKTPAERHAEMIASFLGFSEHTASEERRIRDLAMNPQRQDRIKEVHKLISEAKSPEEANRYKNELKTLREEIKAAEVDAEIQQKRMETAKNVLGTYGVTLRDIFNGDRIRASRQAPAVKAAIDRMRSEVGKDAAKMILNRQPNKKIQKKLGITEEKIRKFEEDFRKALRLEFGKATQQMAQRDEQSLSDEFVLVPEDVRNANQFHGEESGQFDIAKPEHAVWAARTLATVFNGNIYNAINEFWINSILSGPQTQAINVFSNSLNLGWDKTIQTGLESIFNQIIPGDKAQGAQYGDIRRFWKGFSKGIAPAWRNAVSSFKNDGLDFFESWAMQEPVSQFDASKVESAYLPSIQGRKGRIIRMPGNALQAMDTLFKTSIAMGEVAVQAYRIANAQVQVGDLRQDQMESRIEELMEHGSPAWILAIGKAKELTFTKEFRADPEASKREQWMSMVQKFRNAKIQKAEQSMIKMGLSFLFPFIRTPYRIFEIGLRKAPITGTANLFYKVIKSGIATYGPEGKMSFNANYGEAGRSELIRDITEQGIASVVMTILFGAAEGDEDDEDKNLLIVGSRPYAPGGHSDRQLADRLYGSSTIIRIGGRNGIHIDYGRYEPISTVLASTVDMIREFKKNPNTDGQTWLVNFAGSLANQAQEKTFLQGIRTVADTISMGNDMINRNPEKAEEQIAKSIKDFLRGFVPNLIRQPLRQLDPVPRDRSGYLYSLTNVGAFGLPKHDLYGRDLEKTLVGPARLLVRTPYAAADLHKGDAFLSSLSIKRPDLISTFPTSWGGSTTNKFKNSVGEWEDMTDEQRNAFSKLAGQKFSVKVNQWANPLKISRPTEDDLKDFKALLSEARREAKDQLFINGRYIGPTR